MKLKFHTGTIIEVNDEHLLKILKKDKRYTEVKSKKDDKEPEKELEKDEEVKDTPKKDEE